MPSEDQTGYPGHDNRTPKRITIITEAFEMNNTKKATATRKSVNVYMGHIG